MWKGAVAMVIFGVVLVWLQYPRAVSQQEYLDHIKDKVVVICGASSGIGKHLAYKLGEQGAQIMIVARTQSKLEKVKEGAIAAGAKRVEVFPYDFSNVEKSGSVIDKAIEVFGRIDYLVLNHASLANGFLFDREDQQSPQFIDRMFRINTFSILNLALKAMPFLEKSQGHIFVTSSMAGETPVGSSSLYSSTKHALNGFFYSLQQELLARESSVGITIGALGLIVTEDFEAILDEQLDKMPSAMKGDVNECAVGIMDSLVTRSRTYTYPLFFNKFLRSLWYLNPYFQDLSANMIPMDTIRDNLELFQQRARDRGFQKGNF